MPKTYWMKKLKLKSGALTNYVKRKFGKRGFTGRGTIRKAILSSIAHNEKIRLKIRKRANLALVFRTP